MNRGIKTCIQTHTTRNSLRARASITHRPSCARSCVESCHVLAWVSLAYGTVFTPCCTWEEWPEVVESFRCVWIPSVLVAPHHRRTGGVGARSNLYLYRISARVGRRLLRDTRCLANKRGSFFSFYCDSRFLCIFTYQNRTKKTRFACQAKPNKKFDSVSHKT